MVLRIGGEVVFEETYPAFSAGFPSINMPPLLNRGFKIMLDSTHFPSGSLVVEAETTNNYGELATRQITVNNKNKAIFFAYPEQEIRDAVISARQSLSGTNYFCSLIPNGAWPATTLFNQMIGANVAIVATHGAGDKFNAGDNSLVYFEERPDGMSIKSQRKILVGTYDSPQPFPPYNSTKRPMFNIVYQDSCSSGVYWAHLSWLYPNRNAYNWIKENLAALGWRHPVYAEESQLRMSLIIPPLVSGKTVQQVIDEMDEWLRKPENQDRVHVNINGVKARVVAGDLLRFGDQHARIRKLYAGSSSYPAD